uniref:Glycosylphosphatidylinositol anchor attachment 1 protein n=1 Tax=Anthurium amnicola TaxID=1678845 RepID=A0A1D1Y2S1_9ARAE
MGKEKPNSKKGRLIVRLGAFLISHSVLVSILFCTAGYVALFLLPILAKNTYVSENALMPGSANPMFSVQDTQVANRLVKDIIGLGSEARNRFEVSRLIAQNMADLGAEVYYHKTYPKRNQFHPLHFFSNSDTNLLHENGSCTSVGISCVGIIRAPRGDGKESIVLVSPYNSDDIELSDAMTLGLGFSVFSLLSRVTWLAKDIIWLVSDTRHGEYNSVAAWLRDYHHPTFLHDPWNANIGFCAESDIPQEWQDNMVKAKGFSVFRRAGTMAAALVLQVKDREEGNEMDTLSIFSEASNGQMPNLDLINIVHYLAVHRQALRVKVDTFSSFRNSAYLKLVGEILERLSKIAGSFNPKWAFGIPASDYVEGTATLASSIYSQALGVPTGSHGAFRDYQIDAITLEVSPKISLNFEFGRSTILLKGGRLIEGVIRSVNNLLEKFHQSFFLYLLTSPNKFVSVGVYMVAFALLVAPLPIVAAALFSDNIKTSDSTNISHQKTPSSDTSSQTGCRWKWLHSARVVLTVHLWAATVSLLPCLISHLPNLTSESSTLIWVFLSIITLLVLYHISGSPYSSCHPDEWITLKAVMISDVSIGLSLMSIINFSTAQIGAMLVVPMCLLVHPLRRGQGVLLSTCNLFLGVICFPPAALLIGEILVNGSRNISVGFFWDWMDSLWTWNSATYLYLLLVHLPCWALCMHVLAYP